MIKENDKMNESYTYPVIFDFSEKDNILITIPNFSDNINIIDKDDNCSSRYIGYDDN